MELSRAMMCLSTQGQLFTQRESETYSKSYSRVEILRLETLAPELQIALSRAELIGSSTSCVVWLSTPKPKMIQLLLAVGTMPDSRLLK